MRSLACALVAVVLGLACNDNTHPDPLKNELPNGGFVNLSVGQGAVTTTSSASGFGGFGSTSTGGSLTLCDCVVSFNGNSGNCKNCFNTASALCDAEYQACFNGADPGCIALSARLQACGTDSTCQRGVLFDNSNPNALSLYYAYLNCECSSCASDCAVAIPGSCSAPPATSSTGTGGSFP